MNNWYSGKYPHQRKGQAFVNWVKTPENLNPVCEEKLRNLFYATENVVIEEMILDFISNDCCHECNGENGNHFLNCSAWNFNNRG